ncbi:apolipoprotein N-acyltransferase [Streptomyces kaniharaensis]|uniref:Apolipoprotein N-acyltransferase n=1 Tax=Streptomyces kaniharaensis TaxID=212423 RepID=A0A6N7KNE4_9ACTN|nr:apolipoprotein N-acyltransferase [Streptomyces kaniharaensis]MQS11153.1 apolipoprotein N-acyltransferase [Streptomyces kaniharaensis]
MSVTQERSAAAPEPPSPGSRPGRGARVLARVRAGLPRTGLAVLAGLLLALAFPPFDLWPLSLVGVAALSLLTRDRTVRQAAWTGFAFGLPFFLLLLSWLRVVGWDATIGLSIVEALFLLLLGAGLAVTSRLPAWPLWAACLWVTQEWARDRLPLGGFPWGRLAFANTATPYTPLAAIGGAPLVTFAVALSGALLAWAALRLRGPGRAPKAAALAALGAVAALLAGYVVPVPTAADDTVKVAIVQGNVPNPGMDFLGRPMMVLNNHAAATERLAADIKAGKVDRPDVVIWPENSSDLDPFSDPLAYRRIDQAVRTVGVPTLVGTLVDGPDAQHVQNEGIVWDPQTGPGASYTKQHPVPFGEYVPFRAQLMKVITRLQRVARDFYPGDHNGVMQLGPARIGDVICFEVAYDEIVRDTVDSGARVLVVQTNNATYAKTGQPDQQLAMSRLRAVEHGRAVLIAATSGISAVIAPDGTVQQRTEELTAAELSATVPLRDGTTIADRVGVAPEWTLAIGGLLACGAGVLVARRRRPAAGTPAAGDSLK